MDKREEGKERFSGRLCQPKCVEDSPTTCLLKQMWNRVNLRGGTNSGILVLLAAEYAFMTNKT